MKNSIASRLIAAGAALALAATALTGCSSASSDNSEKASSCEPAKGKVTLQYWNWVPGMQEVVNLWNKQNPNIQVQIKNIANNSAQQIANAVKANKAPDLAQVGYDSLAEFRSQNYLQDVSSCSSTTAAKAKFTDWTWSQTSFNGEGVFAYPQDTGPMVMYYRADLFDKYKIAVPTTWDEFREAGKKLKAADPNLAITSFDPSNSWSYTGLLWQKGATMYQYKDNKWVVSLDSAQGRQVADYWQGLISDGTVRTDLKNGSTALMSAYSKSQLATLIGAAWSYTSLRDNVPDQSGKWRVAALPGWSAKASESGNWGGSTVAFIKGGKHPYEAAKFSEWLNTDPTALKILNDKGGLYPAAKAGTNLNAFKKGTKYYGGQNIFSVFKASADAVSPGWQWGPTQTTAYTSMNDAMTKAVSNGTPLSGALPSVQTAVVKAMKDQSIPVATSK